MDANSGKKKYSRPPIHGSETCGEQLNGVARSRVTQIQQEACYNPTTNGGIQSESSVGTCTRCTHIFARLVPICRYAQSVIIDKNSASELSQKFIKGALLVG